ncbi:MAG: hypothetical protein PHT40_00565 [Patescibacteria group bacterium]|nr:hypothetical protein [Patescibacteria group bacterium]
MAKITKEQIGLLKKFGLPSNPDLIKGRGFYLYCRHFISLDNRCFDDHGHEFYGTITGIEFRQPELGRHNSMMVVLNTSCHLHCYATPSEPLRVFCRGRNDSVEWGLTPGLFMSNAEESTEVSMKKAEEYEKNIVFKFFPWRFDFLRKVLKIY